MVRELGDVEILESYFLLVWSEWNYIRDLGEMIDSIRGDFGPGIGVGHHREVLIERLDHVLGQLDRGLEHLRKHNPNLEAHNISTAEKDYGRLRDVLLEVDREALEILTRTPFR